MEENDEKLVVAFFCASNFFFRLAVADSQTLSRIDVEAMCGQRRLEGHMYAAL
jgi:hypothetical protein